MIKRFVFVLLVLFMVSLSIFAGHRPVGDGPIEYCEPCGCPNCLCLEGELPPADPQCD